MLSGRYDHCVLMHEEIDARKPASMDARIWDSNGSGVIALYDCREAEQGRGTNLSRCIMNHISYDNCVPREARRVLRI